MAIPSWFNYNVYMANKLTATSGYTMEQLVVTFSGSGFGGEEGAYRHFMLYGANENVSPTSLFDANEYFSAKAAQMGQTAAWVQQAIQDAGMNAWTHYTLYGTSEGISPSSRFNTNGYLSAKLAQLQATDSSWQGKTIADVAEAIRNAGLSAVEHYLLYGKGEGLTNSDYVNEADDPVIPIDPVNPTDSPFPAAPVFQDAAITMDPLEPTSASAYVIDMDAWGYSSLGIRENASGNSITITNNKDIEIITGTAATTLTLEGGISTGQATSRSVDIGNVNGGTLYLHIGKNDEGYSIDARASNSEVNIDAGKGGNNDVILLDGGIVQGGGTYNTSNEIHTYGGDDYISVGADAMGRSMYALRNSYDRIETGSGNDTVVLHGAMEQNHPDFCTTGRGTIYTGEGDDLVVIQDIISGASVDLGSGNDTLCIVGDLAIGDYVTLWGGDGSDKLALESFQGSSAITMADLANDVRGFEILDVSGDTANTINLSSFRGTYMNYWGTDPKDDLLSTPIVAGGNTQKFRASDDVVLIQGDASDTLNISYSWNSVGTIAYEGATYTVFDSSQSRAPYVAVQQEMAVNHMDLF